jgi:hypothetical protein
MQRHARVRHSPSQLGCTRGFEYDEATPLSAVSSQHGIDDPVMRLHAAS